MLKVESLEAGYGKKQVLFGISLEVRQGEVVALMGRNGMGKTTTINTVIGVLQPRAGAVRFEGRAINGLAPHRIARLGIGVVPEGRQVFPTLTVRENLVATAANYGGLATPWTVERVFDFLPQLRPRSGQMGGTLSGGEQQMLAIGRALMLGPKLLILDEATEGLAPLIRDEIWQRLRELRNLGHSILLIDKNLDELAPIADRAYIVEKGRDVWQGDIAELTRSEELRVRYLGV
jgi:branched-chain amino acid transport system ATP-binding protein